VFFTQEDRTVNTQAGTLPYTPVVEGGKGGGGRESRLNPGKTDTSMNFEEKHRGRRNERERK